VLGLPWLDDEQASLQFGTTRALTLMDGTTVETEIEKRHFDGLLMSFGKIQKSCARSAAAQDVALKLT
jgi:hypothetical protein